MNKQARVFSAVRGGQTNSLEISKSTGIAVSAVSERLRYLARRGLIERRGKFHDNPKGGRPAYIYTMPGRPSILPSAKDHDR